MDLYQARQALDEIDEMLMRMFCERMDIITSIADCKQRQGLAVLDPAREAGKLRAAASIGGERYGDYTSRLMSHLMSLSRDYQRQLRQPEDDATPA